MPSGATYRQERCYHLFLLGFDKGLAIFRFSSSGFGFVHGDNKLREGKINLSRFFTAAIVTIEKQLGIAPGIVIGRLQHDNLVVYSHHIKLKRRLDGEDSI